MMGRIAQLKRITRARIDAFLSAVEKPEHVLPQLEKEIAQKVTEAANAEAKALAATRGAQRRVDEAAGRMLRLETGVKNALRAEDVSTARRAVAALLDAEKNTERLRRSLETAHAAYLNASHVRLQLQENLNDLKTRKDEILARSRLVALRKQVTNNATLNLAAGSEVLEVVSRMETRLDHEQTEIEARNHLHLDLVLEDQSLDRKLHDADVDSRLAELKAKFTSF